MKTNHPTQLLLACLFVLATMNVRAAEEQELIAALQSAASAPEKCAACQQGQNHGISSWIRSAGSPKVQ
jgi:hypothetical protein